MKRARSGRSAAGSAPAAAWPRALAAAGAILLSAAALYLLFALLDYHASDMDTIRSGAVAPVFNRTGPLGAWLAEWAFWLFGYGAYAFSALAAWPALARLTGALDRIALGALRALGFAALLASASALLALGLPTAEAMPNGAGGWLGAWLAERTWAVLGQIGAWLAFSAAALAGLTLYAVISWRRVGEWTLSALARCARWLAAGARAASAVAGATADALAGALAAAARARAALADIAARRSAPAPAERAASRRSAPAPAERAASRRSAPARIEPTLSGADLDSMPAISASGEDLPAGRRPLPRAARRSAPVAAAARPAAAGARAPASAADASPLPSVGLLAPARRAPSGDGEAMRARAEEMEIRLRDFGIAASVTDVLVGPTVTLFELKPEAGTKASRISALASDLARAMATPSVRVVEVIPGKSVIGIELPNRARRPVALREVIETDAYRGMDSPLALALGQDIAGAPVVADLAEMPHLLVAGTTGAGKSVALNTMLLSMLYKAGPERLRLLLVDPKMLELSLYEGIPQLLAPVVTDMRQATRAMRWCVAEMERRYALMSKWGVRSVAAYRDAVSGPVDADEPPERLPSIVVVIDEFADMIMVVGKRAEEAIIRVAQKARAAGIHLVLATQRPSVNVITGLIKANIPARIALKVPSRIDSRTVLDQGGAEQLLGHGDMLFLRPGGHAPMRLQGAFVSDQEVHRVVADWRRRAPAARPATLLDAPDDAAPSAPVDADADADLYAQAVAMVTERRQVSISSLQRRFRIGYNRAARLVDRMQEDGIVSEMNDRGARAVLDPKP